MKTETSKPPAAFTKEQFLKSKQRSGGDKDILAAVLEDGKTYSIDEADAAIQVFIHKEAQ